jgi:hypothetical protein
MFSKAMDGDASAIRDILDCLRGADVGHEAIVCNDLTNGSRSTELLPHMLESEAADIERKNCGTLVSLLTVGHELEEAVGKLSLDPDEVRDWVERGEEIKRDKGALVTDAVFYALLHVLKEKRIIDELDNL